MPFVCYSTRAQVVQELIAQMPHEMVPYNVGVVLTTTSHGLLEVQPNCRLVRMKAANNLVSRIQMERIDHSDARSGTNSPLANIGDEGTCGADLAAESTARLQGPSLSRPGKLALD